MEDQEKSKSQKRYEEARLRQQMGGGEIEDYLHQPRRTGYGSHKSDKEWKDPDEKSAVIDEYLYQDANGAPYLQVVRYEPKAFAQMHWEQKPGERGQWVSGAPNGPRIPYFLPSLIAAPKGKPIFICEGEKDCHTLIELGLEATCSDGGAKRWTADHSKWFEGRQRVFILEDNDAAGREHSRIAAKSLKAHGVKEVRIVSFPDVPIKGDVSDWLAAGHTKDELLRRCDAAPIFGCNIFATPFEWIEPKDVPPRQWLYKPHYVRGFISATVASGGSGKSSLSLVEALAMATGRPLLGVQPIKKMRVWVFNLEDPIDELQRRVAAICKYYKIPAEEIDGQLFLNSGRTTPLIIAEDTRNVATVNTDTVGRVTAEIKNNLIDVMMIDPFVASHLVPENDNSKINLVVRTWSQIAEEANCSIMMIHHLRKTGDKGATVDDGRGASALIAAARSARVINTMDGREAEKAEIVESQRRFYFRSDVGKANLSPPAERADWYKLESVDLQENFELSDHVGVVAAWTYPKTEDIKANSYDIVRILKALGDGKWRLNPKSQKEPWVGIPVAREMGLDLTKAIGKRNTAALVGNLISTGVLMIVKGADPKGNEREYVVAGSNSPAKGTEEE